MDDAERAGQPVVLQVEVEGLELRGGEHALVDERLAGQAREVDGLPTGAVLARALGAQLVLGALAHHEAAALELHTAGAADEHLAEGRHGVAGERAEGRVVGGDVTPAEQGQALGLDDLSDRLARCGGVAGRLRQERDAGGVGALLGQFEVDDVAQEGVGHLQQDSGAVAGVRFGALCTAVFQVQQRGDRLVDDVAAAPTVNVGDHRDTAGVVFIRGVVQPLFLGRHSHLTLRMRVSMAAVNDGSSLAMGAPACSTERRAWAPLATSGETI